MAFKPFTEFLTGPIVTLVIGPNHKAYYVHHGLLCDRSSYFRAALQGQFQEAQANRIEFPEEDETTFEIFIRWLYGSKFEVATTSAGLRQAVTVMGFARRIVLPELHNDFINAVRYRYSYRLETFEGKPTTQVVTVDALSLVYHVVPKQTQLRFCFCLEFALAISKKIEKSEPEDWMSPALRQLLEEPGEFAADFVSLLVYCNRKPDLNPRATFHSYYNCIYHMDTPVTMGPRSLDACPTTVAITVAAKIFDKNLFPDMGDKGEKQGSGM
ncbi:MAG: hypothetical protein Q9198_005270 [Flavoplaca austrocitrina]